MHTVENQTITGEVLRIDGTCFSNCVLANCTLEYSGGPVSFERTRVRNCHYVFFGRARRTVHFLQGFGLLPNAANDWAEFSQVAN